MADREQLRRLREDGVASWNRWRTEHQSIPIDLTHSDLTGADLSRAILTRADLTRADLSQASLHGAHLNAANLTRSNFTEAALDRACLYGSRLKAANLTGARLYAANLKDVDLTGATLYTADLSWADLTRANLAEADLEQARLVATKLNGATLDGCRVYGLSTWEVQVDSQTRQTALIASPPDAPTIATDNLALAQLIGSVVNDTPAGNVAETFTSRAVLILGCFTTYKPLLDSIRDELRGRDYLPVVLGCDKPDNTYLTGTISTLARMARLIVADLTDPNSIPQELVSIVAQYPEVPVQPVLLARCEPWGMFDHIERYPWVLDTLRYDSPEHAVGSLPPRVVASADSIVRESNDSNTPQSSAL